MMELKNKFVLQQVVGVVGANIDGALPLLGRSVLVGYGKRRAEMVLSFVIVSP